MLFSLISGFLSSQVAAPQVLSAFAGLTAVFGMGTGGSPQLSPLNCYVVQDSYPDNCIKMFFLNKLSARLRIVVLSVYLFPVSQLPEIRSKRFAHVCASPFGSFKHGSLLKSSPRSISTGPLRTSLYFHSRPINHIVFVGPYLLKQ